MSGAEVIVGNVERALTCADRTKSVDAISDRDRSSISINGESFRASSENLAFRVGELGLPNGESYSGSLLGNAPEGNGKYVWSDGCVYEGEWRRGMRHGNGKIQWPSGTAYEGEFSGGYMHGAGTYVGSNNLTYKGRWRLNLKHGLGYQVYPNGDIFEGSWIQGGPEGPGKYTWANRNVYHGDMKGGKMTGKGTLTWTNGDSFEGSWLNGMMHGFGVYTWSDGGCYVGTWTRGLKDGKGSFYPKGSRFQAVEEWYLNALRKRGVLPDLRKQNHALIHHASSVNMGNVKVGENQGSRHNSSDKLSKGNLLTLEQSRNKNVSLERRWSLEVYIEKVIGHDSSLDLSEGLGKEFETNTPPILEREYMQGVLISELVLNSSFSSSSRRTKRRQKKLAKEVKRPGEAIIKGHRSYDLMLSLQLGIRYTVGKITPVQRREVRASDFGPRASFWMNFPKDGSQLTPPHQSEDFKWKDYCPMVFRNLREMFKIDSADYMMSICGNDALRELSSPGKSGSIFFLSQDDHFMIKTLRKSEVKVLLKMFGFGLNLAPTVKLVYIKYLDSLERWLERLLVDGIGLNAELSDRGVNVGGALMELGAEFKGLLSEMPENEFLELNSELNVNAEVESYESEKFAEDEESLHIDSTKSGVDFVEVGESGDNVVKSFMMDGSFSNEDVKGKDVDENLISDSRKSEKVENEDEVKSVVVVETDGDEEGNKGDNSEIEELDLATFEESVSSRKRKRDSIYRMLNWVTEIAKDPCDPVVGSLPEWSKWKSYGNEECWKQVLVTRESLFLKRNADSTSSAEGFVKQKYQKMHPCMYDDHAGSSYNLRERLKCRKLFPGETSSQALVCSQSSSAATQTDSDSCMEGVYDGDSSTECSVLDLPITKRIPVGPVFQAEVPEWTGMASESDSKWLGTRVWPLETSINKFVIEREPIGKGRSDSCGCQVPKSIKCVRFHITERRSRVMRELGKAFNQWRFDKMGEEVKLSWSLEDQKKFGAIVRSNPLSLDKCFWDEIFRCFPSRRREDLVSYYYNVFLLQRRANQNRSTPDSINSDDDESECELVNYGSRREAVNSPGSLISAKKQHKYVK